MTDVSLRPATDADVPFQERLYASTRLEEVARTGWPPEQVDAFLKLQFRAQHTHYTTHYAPRDDVTWDLILVDGEPAGRLIVGRWKKELRIVDIALLPEFRSRGIGRELIEELLAEARADGKPVTIHVEHENRAMSLYHRLGFTPVKEEGPYLLMQSRQLNTAS